ncbi:sensor histidine kinase [Paractinoplanes brasiliensis]|uniref:histidine kinase n=1 Tax=Paractinoplanes brasiliensis TaxID=52695 RepID=A0A4R6JLI9_9ACTN|nr:sensor histidine kinase [Actinoplanes brasiliensis]TDO36999.1 signal transduction histidine kinase [Actinoplanes brasiliensis]GID30522.1 two-component sensor histidine kinase [Actinoplanes brasiliensis]
MATPASGTLPVSATGRLPALAVDTVLGAGFLVALLVERFMQAPGPPGSAVVAGAGLAVATALRRRFPFGAFLLSAAALCLEVLVASPSWLAPYANLLGVFSVALYATRRQARWSLGVLFGCIAVYFTARGGITAPTQPAGVLLVWLAMWSVGYAMARRREEQQTARRLVQERAVAGERARIARELHDLVGHTVNLMLMQAGAGRRVLDKDPEKTRGLLSDLERAGRDALTELDRVLGVLRSDDPGGDQPADASGLALLPDLARRMTEAGLRVTVRIDDGLAELPRSLDLTAYRIIQESLTNALKHADARTAGVSLRRDGQWLEMAIRDDGRGPATDYRPGRGLLGIRERVALFEGTVTYGPAGRAGFQVTARLPLTPAEATTP